MPLPNQDANAVTLLTKHQQHILNLNERLKNSSSPLSSDESAELIDYLKRLLLFPRFSSDVKLSLITYRKEKLSSPFIENLAKYAVLHNDNHLIDAIFCAAQVLMTAICTQLESKGQRKPSGQFVLLICQALVSATQDPAQCAHRLQQLLEVLYLGINTKLIDILAIHTVANPFNIFRGFREIDNFATLLQTESEAYPHFITHILQNTKPDGYYYPDFLQLSSIISSRSEIHAEAEAAHFHLNQSNTNLSLNISAEPDEEQLEIEAALDDLTASQTVAIFAEVESTHIISTHTPPVNDIFEELQRLTLELGDMQSKMTHSLMIGQEEELDSVFYHNEDNDEQSSEETAFNGSLFSETKEIFGATEVDYDITSSTQAIQAIEDGLNFSNTSTTETTIYFSPLHHSNVPEQPVPGFSSESNNTNSIVLDNLVAAKVPKSFHSSYMYGDDITASTLPLYTQPSLYKQTGHPASFFAQAARPQPASSYTDFSMSSQLGAGQTSDLFESTSETGEPKTPSTASRTTTPSDDDSRNSSGNESSDELMEAFEEIGGSPDFGNPDLVKPKGVIMISGNQVGLFEHPKEQQKFIELSKKPEPTAPWLPPLITSWLGSKR
jgi:hypothetical protein